MSVVKVIVFSREGVARGTGSATLLFRATGSDEVPRHLFITNSHVVTETPRVLITQPRTPNVLLEAEVLGVSQAADIAVLSVKEEGPEDAVEMLRGLDVLKTKPSMQLETFEGTAEGYPLGLPEISKSPGLIVPQVAVGRIVYQTSATLNGGNSGGALFDEDGYYRGVPFAGIMFVSDIGFCITDLEALAVADAIVGKYRGSSIALQPLQLDVGQVSEPFPVGSVIGGKIRVVQGPGGPLGIFQEAVTATIPLCMRLLPEGSYPVVLDDQVVTTVTTRYPTLDLGLRNSLPFLTVDSIHMAPVTKDHVSMFPHLAVQEVPTRALIITAADPDSPHGSFVGSIVESVNGIPVQTAKQASDALQEGKAVSIQTTVGHLVL